MFTIYSADVTGNPGNCSYPHKHVILDEDSLKAAICHHQCPFLERCQCAGCG